VTDEQGQIHSAIPQLRQFDAKYIQSIIEIFSEKLFFNELA
jgi:hypothetical protein